MTFSSGEVLTAANLNALSVNTVSVEADQATQTLTVNNATNITPDGSSTGHIQINGSGYAGCFSLDATGFWMSQNSASRSIILATNETARMDIDGTGHIQCGDSTAFGGTLGYLNVKGLSNARGIQVYQPTTGLTGVAFAGMSDVGGTQSFRVIIRSDGDLENVNNSYGAYSDERLKTIEPARDYLADLQKLEVKNFKLTSRFVPTQVTVTDDEGNETTEDHPTEGAFVERDEADYSPKQLGLIAQQVEEHIPGLVKEDDYGVKALRYSVLVPMLLQAVQTLTARVEELEA